MSMGKSPSDVYNRVERVVFLPNYDFKSLKPFYECLITAEFS